jgi:hypothetical protein
MKDNGPEIMLAIALCAIVLSYGLGEILKIECGFLAGFVFQIVSYLLILYRKQLLSPFRYLIFKKKRFKKEDFQIIQSEVEEGHYNIRLLGTDTYIVLLGEPKLSDEMKTEFTGSLSADYWLDFFIRHQSIY